MVLIERRYYFQIQAHVSCLGNTVKMKILLPFWLHSPLSPKVQAQAAFAELPAVTNTAQLVCQPPQQQAAPQSFPASVVTPSPRATGAPSSTAPENRTTDLFCGSCGAGRSAATVSFCTQCGSQF